MSLSLVTPEQIRPPEANIFARRERVLADTETWLAETLNGSMRTRFTYTYSNGDLCGEDGGRLGPIFDDAIEDAERIVASNPSLNFELRRRIIEKGEYEDMLGMADSDNFNTMVIVSDFPPELMDSTKDVGGYNVSRKQTMLRVITRDQSGEIVMTQQSLDGSDRESLELLYTSLGSKVEDGELLEQRMYLNLPEDRQACLTDFLTERYDDSMTNKFGGDWHAGIRQRYDRQMVDTYSFVRQQVELTDWFIRKKLADPHGAERIRFNVAAAMSEAYEKFVGIAPAPFKAARQVIVSGVQYRNLEYEIQLATQKAITTGKVFSGCGASVRAESSSESQLEESGYGNKTDENCEFISKTCPLCNAKNVKTVSTSKEVRGSCGCVKKKS